MSGIQFGQIAGATRIKRLSGGRKVVASAGTAEQVYTSKEFINGLVIQALHDNSTRISVGGPDTLATDNSESGIMLDAGETVTVYCENPSIVYIDALTNGEGCNFLLLES